MNINFYRTTDENNVVYKTLTNELAFQNCVLKEKSSVITPNIFVNTNTDICVYNYCYIPEFKRYYYITDIVSATLPDENKSIKDKMTKEAIDYLKGETL